MLSPIQLKEYKVLSISLDTQIITGEETDFNVAQALSVEKHASSPDLWMCRLDLKTEDGSEETKAPYLIEVAVAGMFKLSEDFPDKDAEKMVQLNSGAILYGIIRDLVSNLTIKGIHGDLMIPTIDARSFIEEDKPAEEEK